MTDYTMPVGDDVIQAAGPLLGHISLKGESQEVIRIDAQGFHYRGQFIEDAGEAHRLLVEFLRQHQPDQQWMHAVEPQPELPTDEELMEVFWEHQNGMEELWPGDWPAAARAVLARWGNS